MALNPQSTSLTWRIVLRALLGFVVIIVLVFGSAGRWDYWQGWVYLFLALIAMAMMWIVLPKDSDLVEERLHPGEGMKGWDRVYFALSTPMYLLAALVAGADVGRFGWTEHLPPSLYLFSIALYAIGQSIFLWARYTNRYFSSVARIQLDRGQTVCNAGPYRFVRHPGYVGGILFGIAMPLILGSLWALIPQGIAAVLLVWRTYQEDHMLLAELPGYAAYSKETRYHLLPGIW